MKRHWNLPIWAGFAIVIAADVSYIPLFALFPFTRDVPWANYRLFLVGGFAIQKGREIAREVFTGVADYRLKQEHVDAQLKKFWEHRIDSN